MEKKTVEILKEAGWYEGRKIDIKEIIKFLESKGCYVHEKAKKFIEEFGMLNIEAPTQFSEEIIKKYDFPKYDKHTTDIYDLLGGAIDAEYSEQYEDDTEEKLVIVGALDDNNLYIMISESGKVYCDTGKLGDNFEEAWDTMLTPGRSPVAWQFL